MPIRLSDLSADRRTVKVPFGDDTLTLVCKPSALNAIQEARELEDRAVGRVVMSQARSLAELIISWDLLDDDGKPLPVSEEVLGGLGLDVSNKLYNAVLDDLLPNRRRPTSSPDGSSAAESSAPAGSPAGTTIS
jgi:hypothetical protein